MSYVLTENEFNTYWYKIITGTKIVKYDETDTLYKIRYPFPFEWQEANYYYDQKFNEAKEYGIRTYKEIKRDVLRKYPILSQDEQDKLDILKVEIEKEKKNLLRLRFDIQIKQKKELIDKLETEYYGILFKKFSYYKDTAESLAEIYRNKYFLYKCLYILGEQESVYKNFNNVLKETNIVFIKTMLNELTELINGLSHEIIRAIAREPIVNIIWRTSRKTGTYMFGFPIEIAKGLNNMFNYPTSWWTADQRNLANWLLYYDNVKESFDPPEFIFKDDDKLDKWVDMEIKKRDSERIKNLGHNRSAFEHDDVIVFGEQKEMLFDENNNPLWEG